MLAREINLRKPEDGSSLEQCHLMPCRIEHKDPVVKAREYFWPTVKLLKAGGDDDEGRDKSYTNSVLQKELEPDRSAIQTASFRGRPLQGRQVKVPEGFAGHLIIKDSRIKDKNNRTFDEFTYWNWDELPSKEDTVMKALQWIDISAAIHGNVKAD